MPESSDDNLLGPTIPDIGGELARLVEQDAARADLWNGEADAQDTRERLAVLHFRLGESWYGIPTEMVKQVVSMPQTYPIPTTPPHVLGVANLGGQVVPLMDLRKFLDIPADAFPMIPIMAAGREVGERRMVVVDARGMICGFPVDLVRQVIEVIEDDIDDARISEGKVRHYALGEVEYNGRRLTLLDLPAILEGART